jgi:hypothetical protein
VTFSAKSARRVGVSIFGLIIAFGGVCQFAEYVVRGIDWISQKWPNLQIHWPTVFNLILVVVGLLIVAYVNLPSRAKIIPLPEIKPLPPATTEPLPSPANGRVAALIAVENHIMMAASQSIDHLVKVTTSGDIERAKQFAKEEVESCFPALMESTLGIKEREKYLAVTQKAKETSPDNWHLAHTVATRYLFGVAIASMSKKLTKLNSDMSQDLVELARKIVNG